MDLVVLYRIYPRVTKPTFIFPESKIELARACLRSLVDSLGDLEIHFHAILDGCPPAFYEMIRQVIPRRWGLTYENVERAGNYATFTRQTVLALDFYEKHRCPIMFAEDDYFYLPKALSNYLRELAMNSSWIYATPYRHPDLRRNIYWKWFTEATADRERNSKAGTLIPSTCLTFIARKPSNEHMKHFSKFGRKYGDCALWLAVTLRFTYLLRFWTWAIMRRDHRFERIFRHAMFLKVNVPDGGDLLQPLVDVATHAEIDFLAEETDWKAAFSKMLCNSK